VAVAIAASPPIRSPPLLLFGALAALLIVYTHRGNISRMRGGTESRARRLWLLGPRRGPG
jgi:glycerol-3-phosphate acyltransferase PlsY